MGWMHHRYLTFCQAILSFNMHQQIDHKYELFLQSQ